MKSSVLSLVLAAGLVAAQAKLPTCASKCITEYTTGGKIAGCGQVDIACICKNQDFLNGISCCLQESCDTAGQEAAIKYAGQICSTAGVTVPDKLSCSSSSSKSGSSSATKSASGSTGTPDSTATGKATGTAAESGSSTGTATGSSSSSTSSGSAAAGTYSAGGLLGAVAAVLFAL